MVRGTVTRAWAWTHHPSWYRQVTGRDPKADLDQAQRAQSERRHRFVHAYPGVENAASNALCQRLGFTLLGAYDFEYPKGQAMRCNDWRLDLFDG